MWKEFKDFAMRGNVVDMAVGVIIGGAFGKIVTSLVNDILMPPLGLLIGNMDFSDLKINLGSPLSDAKPVSVNYGLFINNVTSFMIVAFSIFTIVRILQHMRRKGEPAPAPEPVTKECPFCFSPIPVQATRCAHCTSHLNQSESLGGLR